MSDVVFEKDVESCSMHRKKSEVDKCRSMQVEEAGCGKCK